MQFINELLEHPSLFAYFSGANNYTWLQFRNGERRLLAKPLTYFADRLPSFIRIHKTALVNPTFVASVQHPPRAKMPGTVRMQDGVELPVSRRRWPEVNRQLQGSPPEAINMGGQPKPSVTVTPYVPPSLLVLAVMTGDALLLTQQCIQQLKVDYHLQPVERGAELTNALLLSPSHKWPALIILDARTNRADRILALRDLKSHPRLRAIPIVWLAAPGDNTMQAYDLNANSVVEAPNEPTSFVSIIDHLCRYWLIMVQLPPEADH